MWGTVPSAAGAPSRAQAETQSHIQCLCPGLKNARIRALHNLAHLLWRVVSDASKMIYITAEQAVDGEEQITAWRRAWDEITDMTLMGQYRSSGQVHGV